jgi:hypothetical protein
MGRAAQLVKDRFNPIMGVHRGLGLIPEPEVLVPDEIDKTILEVECIECGFEGTREQVHFTQFINVIVEDLDSSLQIGDTLLASNEAYRWYHDDDAFENFAVIDRPALQAQVSWYKKKQRN